MFIPRFDFPRLTLTSSDIWRPKVKQSFKFWWQVLLALECTSLPWNAMLSSENKDFGKAKLSDGGSSCLSDLGAICYEKHSCPVACPGRYHHFPSRWSFSHHLSGFLASEVWLKMGMIGWLVDWLLGCLVDWLVGWVSCCVVTNITENPTEEIWRIRKLLPTCQTELAECLDPQI